MKSRKTRKTGSPSPPADRPRAGAPPGAATGGPRLAWLCAAVALSAVLVVASSFFPGARLWGINHLAFFPPAVRWTVAVLLALAFVPGVARPVYGALLRLAQWFPASRSRAVSVIAAVGIFAAAVTMFVAFRSSTLLLGDGQLIARSFEAAEEGNEEVVMRNPGAIVNEETIAPGVTLLYYGAVQVATGPLHKTPVFGLRAINCLLGGLFVLVLLWVASTAFFTSEQRIWLLGMGLFSCSIELFFGYIENYTAPFLLLFLYTITAVRALRDRGPLWLPLLPLVLAVYGHVQSILFAPSFVYVVWWRRSRRRDALLRMWTPLFVCVAMIGVAMASMVPSLKRFYVPFGFRNDAYALLAPHHLADILNEVFMLLPIAPLVFALAWVTWRAERGSGRAPANEARAAKEPFAWLCHPCEWQFAVTILIPCLLYLVLFHPEIGMARDWDLFTMATIAIVPMTLMLLHRYRRATGVAPEALARFAVPALAVTVATGVAWVGVNASVERTVNRFERILSYDRTHASYAWENLAVLQHDRGELERSIATMRTACDVSRNPRQYVRLAVYLEEAGQTDEAIKILDDVLARRPAFTKARFRLVMFLEQRRDWPRLLEVAKGGVENNPDEAIYHFFYGESLMRMGRTEEALEAFRACRSMDLPPEAKKYVEATLREHEQAGK